MKDDNFFEDLMKLFMETINSERVKITWISEDKREAVSSVFFPSSKIYETAIKIEGYNKGDWIIVSRVSSLSKCEKAHDSWVEKITNREDLEGIMDVLTYTYYLKDN